MMRHATFDHRRDRLSHKVGAAVIMGASLFLWAALIVLGCAIR
jgi:hypothetical protein